MTLWLEGAIASDLPMPVPKGELRLIDTLPNAYASKIAA
jgi:hypothetical protein